jgi:hypothetical protein
VKKVKHEVHHIGRTKFSSQTQSKSPANIDQSMVWKRSMAGFWAWLSSMPLSGTLSTTGGAVLGKAHQYIP